MYQEREKQNLSDKKKKNMNHFLTIINCFLGTASLYEAYRELKGDSIKCLLNNQLKLR